MFHPGNEKEGLVGCRPGTEGCSLLVEEEERA